MSREKQRKTDLEKIRSLLQDGDVTVFRIPFAHILTNNAVILPCADALGMDKYPQFDCLQLVMGPKGEIGGAYLRQRIWQPSRGFYGHRLIYVTIETARQFLQSDGLVREQETNSPSVEIFDERDHSAVPYYTTLPYVLSVLKDLQFPPLLPPPALASPITD